MTGRQELPPINFKALADALLASADTLVPAWLSGGRRQGHEWVCGSLAGEAGSSCSVNLHTGKWADFSSDEKGADLLSLYAAIQGLSMTRAAVQIARELGFEDVAGVVKRAAGAGPAPAPNPRPAPPPKPVPEQREGWHTLTPVPPGAPKPTYRHQYRQPEDIQHIGAYRLDDAVFGYVVRFRTSDGGKDTLPYTYCQSDRGGGQKWHWRQWDEPRPLYLPSGALPGQRTVVLVEGEVKGDVLQGLLESAAPGVYCVASWPGGSKAWQKADWSWLSCCTVLAWPDCDAQREPLTRAERESVKDDAAAKEALTLTKPILPEGKQPGIKAMRGILALLRDVHGCTVSILPIPAPGAVVSGWDCKDAIQTDGWTGVDVLAFFGRAQPLPVDLPADADGPVPAPEPHGSVGTEEVDSASGDDYELVKCGKRRVPRWLSWYWDDDKGRWNISRKAVIAALEKDVSLQGVAAFCELSNTVKCRRAWPWPHAKPGEVRNADALLLGKYLTDTYGLPSVSKASLEEAIQTVAYAERFHPIREWIVGLQWDGKPRLSKWLVYALGETPESLPPAVYEYLCLVGRYWLQGMVWRVMEPGCKFDYCPVLEGEGGLRKSTLVEVLASTDYFSDTPFDVGRGKEAQEQVQGIWVYEIAELSALSKADVNAIKAFISSKIDRYRVAYGSTVESFPRQCVMVGTTNEDTYLRDRTGNRRFWPIPVRHQINTEWVARWRTQLFAEAFALYLQGEAYSPTPEQEKRLFHPMQESRLIETAVESDLLRLLTRERGGPADMSNVHVHATFVTMAQLVMSLGADVAKSTPGLEKQIRDWLKQYGWVREKKQHGGARAWGFTRPRVWPPKDDDVPAQPGSAEQPLNAPPEQPQAAELSAAARFLQNMEEADL
ncbi:VapE domain-containing protein [Brachymonas sp.]|uniref:VapE domain-containing protein n=1 Tax=Brachymonas sp. TaxID=1936292 RepID=UPI0035B233D7